MIENYYKQLRTIIRNVIQDILKISKVIF